MRKHLAAGLALVLALSGVAVASEAPSASRARVGVVTGASECGGAGFTKLVVPQTPRGFSCVHTLLDTFDSHALSAARAMGLKPATAKVKCYGDGTSGARIQMIYGYYRGLPNRASTVLPQFRTQMAPRMQAVIDGQGLGKDLGLRFAWTKGCGAIDIKVVEFPRSIQYDDDNPGDPYRQMGRMITYLSTHGFTREDRKYQVLFDGWNVGACGIGQTAELLRGGPHISSLPGFPLADGFGTVGGHTDPGSVLHAGGVNPIGSTLYSLVWNHSGGPRGPSCFNTQGISTVTPQLHELFHTLGAVQLDAPHANTGHCDDAPSVMCPGQGPGYGGGISNPSCRKVLIETLDCGMDDYWNPNPPATGYLATHLNIARSQFFGNQPQDYLAPSPV